MPKDICEKQISKVRHPIKCLYLPAAHCSAETVTSINSMFCTFICCNSDFNFTLKYENKTAQQNENGWN